MSQAACNGDNSQTQEFVRLLLLYQTRIYGYILTLVHSYADADDIMQETLVVMWDKYAEEAPVQRFLAWSMSIARYKCMNFCKKKRGQALGFSPEALDILQAISQQVVSNQDERVDALEKCLARLKENDRDLLCQHYEQNQTIAAVAQQVGRSAGGLYKTMARIHELLRLCIERALVGRAGTP